MSNSSADGKNSVVINSVLSYTKNNKTLNSYLQALKNYEKYGNKEEIVQCYFDIGLKYRENYNTKKSLEYFFLTFSATSEQENLKLHLDSAKYIGTLYNKMGDYNKALEYLFYALNFYEKKADKLNIARLYANIANCYNYSNKYEKALEYHFKALEVIESIDNQNLMSHTINDTAVTYYFLENYDEALDYFFRALKIQEKENYIFEKGISENNIGEIFSRQEKFDDALNYFNRAIESNKKNEDDFLLVNILLNLGIVYKKLHNNKVAEEYLDRSFKLAKKLGSRNIQIRIMKILKDIYYIQKKFEKAFDIQEKCYKLKDEIQEEVIELKKMNPEKNKLTEIDIISSSEKQDDKPVIIGISKEMKEIFSLINIISEHNVNVLITGPTGSGKELIARRIHQNFKSDSPFIAINCSAIPEHLLESELFGHTKGAFTGAIKSKKGKIEQASDGTLFLDEIGDMNLSLQAKILRVIQERKVTPVGSTKEIPVTVRVISATNKNLEKLIESSEFRRDLFYRLNVIRVKIPALKDHKSDVPVLVSHFIRKYNMKFDKKIQSISVDALNYLISCEWQGNIRELENEIEKAVLLSTEEILNIDLFAHSNDHTEPSVFEKLPLVWEEYQSYKLNLNDKLDSNYVSTLMESVSNNIQKASETGKLARMQVYRLLKKTSKTE